MTNATRRLLVLLSAAALVAVSCNGGEEPEADGGDGTVPDAELQAFCTAVVDAELRVVAEGPEADVESLLAEVEDNAPEEIRDDVNTVVGAVREGDPSAFETEEFGRADEAVDQYVVDNCGYETVQVSGVDHAFEGIPDTLPAGRVGFVFTNDGEELHEMVVFRINEGVEQPFEEILELPQAEAEAMITFVGASFGPPGETDAETIDLEPGRYGVSCFVPVGSTDPAQPGEGPPHFQEGMLAEFTAE